MNNFVHFQLWRNCPFSCDFCYNKGLKQSDKLHNLDLIIEKLSDKEIYLYKEYGFIGGEIFCHELDDEQVKHKFYEIINICNARIKQGLLHKVYIGTSLMFKNIYTLVEFLEYLKQENTLNHYLLCTSYDTIYRFKNKHMKQIWEYNMGYIHKTFPDINIHTEIILTQDFICKVLNNEFNILEFSKRYNTIIDYIEPQCNINCSDKSMIDTILPNFLLHRKDFLKFLQACIQNKSIDMERFLNPCLHADTVYLEHNMGLYEISNRHATNDSMIQYYKDIGRSIYQTGYIDSDVKITDDVVNVKNMV